MMDHPHRRKGDQMIERLTEHPRAKFIMGLVQIAATFIGSVLLIMWNGYKDQNDEMIRDMKEIKAFVNKYEADKAVLVEKIIVLDKFKDDSLKLREQRAAELFYDETGRKR